MMSALAGKGLGRSKGKGDGKGSRDREVNLSGRRFDDQQLAQWCTRLQIGTAMGLGSVNFSNNDLGDAGARTLVNSLLDIAAPIRVIKLFSNHVGDEGAIALARYIEESQHALAELHLSHNVIKREGAAALLTAGVSAKDKSGGPRYPSFDTVGQCRPVPLWLRLEYNLIEDGQQFQKDMEVKLREARISRGFLQEPVVQVPMLCEAVEGYGCSSRQCSLLCPGGMGGTPGGPVVHAPHLRKQRRPDEVLGGCRSLATLRPSQALLGPGEEPFLGAPKPAGVLPRPRSPPGPVVRFNIGDDDEGKAEQAEKGEKAEKVPLPVKQCRFADVRLTEGGLAPPPAAARVEAAREATPEPRPQAGSAPNASPPKALPKTDQILRVNRKVTATDALLAGYAPENYLQPLQSGEEVLAVYVCEGEEAGWMWAKRSRCGQVEEPGGWLSIEAVIVPSAAHGGS